MPFYLCKRECVSLSPRSKLTLVHFYTGSMNIKLTTLIISLSVMVCAPSVFAVLTPSDGVTVALGGQQARDVHVGRHRFHIDPINLKSGSNGTTANGMIFHAMKFAPDDQIRYKVTVAPNGQETFDIDISRGGAGQFLDIPDNIKGAAGKIIGGDWEPALQVILDTLAAKL